MSGNAKAIRTRMKSVESTMHITRAMQLVASSKMHRATEQMEKSKPFFQIIQELFSDLSSMSSDSCFMKQREVKRACFIVIAGDRGLAGGYNANIFRLVSEELQKTSKETVFVPIGKRACDYMEKHGHTCLSAYHSVEKLKKEECVEMAIQLRDAFQEGEIDEVKIFYTDYVSVLTQNAVMDTILPIQKKEEENHKPVSLEYEPSAEAVLASIIPQYITGVVFGAVRISYTSELASRRNAMDSATKNAGEMMDTLSLSYNRARQAAITQEITEIVGGSVH